MASPAATHSAATPPAGQLALALQEPLTTIARLRAQRQVAADADSFRAGIKQVLASAEQRARELGYAAEDVRFALFAIIAFLDETVLNSAQPMFAEWSRRTLQEEVFGVHMAGELFYQYLQQLVARPESSEVADVLEVYTLCMLLGFRGRYSASQGGEVQLVTRQLLQRIARARGADGDLSPAWRPSTTPIGGRGDPWTRRLAVGAIAATLLAAALYTGFRVSLSGDVSNLRQQTSGLAR